MNLAKTRQLSGSQMKVREYLQLVIDEVLPVADIILLNDERISLMNLMTLHLNKTATFYNDCKYEQDEEGAWRVDTYFLVLDSD